MEQTSVLKTGLSLYRYSADIYDELFYKQEDNTWYIIRRCGVEKYRLNHNHTSYNTDGKILIYPLPEVEIFEEKVPMNNIQSCTELTTVTISNGLLVSDAVIFDMDKKYKESFITSRGTNFSISEPSFIYSVKNTIPHELIEKNNMRMKYSDPNIVINGISSQDVTTNEKGKIISPSVQNVSSIKHLGDSGDIYVTANLTEKLPVNKWNVRLYDGRIWNNFNTNTSDSSGNRNIDIFQKIKDGLFDDKIWDEYLAEEFLMSTSGHGYNKVYNEQVMVSYRDTYLYMNDDYLLNELWKCGWLMIYVNDTLVGQCYQNTTIPIQLKKGINHIEILEKIQTASYCNTSFLDLPYLELMTSQKQKNIFCSEFELHNDKPLKSIGNYYDSFYRDDDCQWKIQRSICEYTFNGSEDFSIADTTNNYTIISVDIGYPIMEDDDSIIAMSNFFHGISYSDYANGKLSDCISAVWSKGGILYFSFPVSTIDEINNFFINNPVIVEYVSSDPDYTIIDNQNYYHNISHQDQLYREKYGLKYDLSYAIEEDGEKTYADILYDNEQVMSYIYPIDVIPCRNYRFQRPSGNVPCVVSYYDLELNLVSFAEILEAESILNIPENVYYCNIFDYNIPDDTSDYSLTEADEYYTVENNEISSLYFSCNGIQIEFVLPHALRPGDELVYNRTREEWMYYPYSLNDDIEYYPSLPINCSGDITLLDEHSGLYLTLVTKSTTTRKLDIPRNISLDDSKGSGRYGYGVITWDEIAGASSYVIYVNDNPIDVVENQNNKESYDFVSEQSGYVTILGKNDLEIGSLCRPLSIFTIPNATKMKSFDSVYENGRYYLTIDFIANSNIADFYEVSYSIDGADTISVIMEHNKIFGELKSFTFYSPYISQNIEIEINPANAKGKNDSLEPVTLLTNNGFSLWTYKPKSNEILLAWNDVFEDESSYSLKYSVNQGEWLTAATDGKSGSGSRLLEYLPLNSQDEMRVCIAAVRNGYTNIYSKPITVSKALDKNLIPPSDFQGTKLETGDIQFTWTDNYDIDANFELYYLYSDGSSNTINIPKESSTTDQYVYIHNVSTYGFIKARIRMVWELGESEYSENIIVYNIPIVEEAPPLHHQEHKNNQLIITWDIYDYIQNYILYFTVDGVQHVIEQVDNVYSWDIPYDKQMLSINVSVKALFIDGTYTNVSKSLVFTVCNADYKYDSIIYTHNDTDNKLDTTIMNRGLESPYPLNTLSMNSFINSFHMFEKTYLPYLFTDYNFVENYWGHNIGEAYRLWTSLKNTFQYPYLLNTIVYTKNISEQPFETLVYYPVSTLYRLSMEITKVVIACLGDSITAG